MLSGLKILLVEDNAIVRATLVLLFETAGAEVIEAGTLAQARDILGLRVPHVAFLDVDLPDGKGTELMAELDGVGVFLMSGSPLPENLDRTRYVEFFSKPFRGRAAIMQIDAWRRDARPMSAPVVPDARTAGRLLRSTLASSA